MKKEKSNGVLIILLIGIIILLLLFITIFETKIISFNNNTNNHIDENNIIDNESQNKQEDKSKNIINIIGEYELKSETESPYYSSTIKISNKTDNTIDFKIETIHGLDIEHVNIGSISEKANKITETSYKFNEEESEIIFKFNQDKLIITEKYKDNINPYGGHGVYFSGEYKKIS